MGILSHGLAHGAAPADDYVVDNSLKFDGSSDLSRAISSAGSLTTFTIAFWVKRGELGTRQVLFSSSNAAGSDFFFAEFLSDDKFRWMLNDGGLVSDADMSSTRVFRDPSAWYHIAMLMSTTAGTGNRMKLYVNGELETQTGTEVPSSYNVEWNDTAYDQYIGDWVGGSLEFDGYLADIYHIDGSAVAPLNNFIEEDSNGQLVPKDYTVSGDNSFHLPFSNTAGADVFVDSSTTGRTITTSGSPVHTRAQKKVGDSSIRFNGSGDYFSIPDSGDWDFGTGNFTIEAWIKVDDLPSTAYETIIGRSSNSGGGWADVGWVMVVDSDGKIMAQLSNSGSAGITLFSSSSLDDGNWHHIALERSSTTRFDLWIDGVSNANSTSNITVNDTSHEVYVGTGYESGKYFDGWIDEIRISNTNRSSESDFATAVSHADDSNTLRLIHSDWNGGLGADASGNFNDFAATNGSHDQTIESPSSGKNFCTFNPLQFGTAEVDLGGGSAHLYEGNLKAEITTSDSGTRGHYQPTTFYLTSGKWYAEFRVNSTGQIVGVVPSNAPFDTYYLAHGAGAGVGMYCYGTNVKIFNYDNGGNLGSDLGTISSGDIIAITLDLDDTNGIAKAYTFGGDFDSGVILNSDFNLKDIGSEWAFCVGNDASVGWTTESNFGQDPTFCGTESPSTTYADENGFGSFMHEPPSGFHAVCTANLDAPGLNNAVDDEKVFAAVTWTGVSSSASDTADVPADFNPDLIWAKLRDDSQQHTIIDSVRGIGATVLDSSDDGGDYAGTSYGVIQNNTTGFEATRGSDGTYSFFNKNGADYVAWLWKAGESFDAGDGSGTGSKNADAGFSIVKWTGNDWDYDSDGGDPGNVTPKTINHGLGAAPELIIAKPRTDNNGWSSGSWGHPDWMVYHKDLSTGEHLALNQDYGVIDTSSGMLGDAPISHVGASTFRANNSDDGTSEYYYLNFGEDTSSWGYTVAEDYIAYCFRSIEGYSKVGSYIGNSSADGPFVYCGFRPAFLLIKTNDSYHWAILDSARDTYNVIGGTPGEGGGLFPSDSQDEYPSSTESAWPTVDFLSNGFKVRTTGLNYNGSMGTELYFYAVADNPFKYANAR